MNLKGPKRILLCIPIPLFSRIQRPRFAPANMAKRWRKMIAVRPFHSALYQLASYKAESINSVLHSAVDAQAVADRYIAQRAFPLPAFQSITFPITNPEIDNSDRDNLLGVFMGQPLNILNLPDQISGGEFEGYVEGWSWSTRFNELFLTINLSPVAYSQVAMRWNTTPIVETWQTIDQTLTWEYATIVS